jgi:hypothetical protein
VPRCFKPEDTEAAFLVEERDPLNQAGEGSVGVLRSGAVAVHLDEIILTDTDNAEFPPSYI